MEEEASDGEGGSAGGGGWKWNGKEDGFYGLFAGGWREGERSLVENSKSELELGMAVGKKDG
jgi:hypothetical protein